MPTYNQLRATVRSDRLAMFCWYMMCAGANIKGAFRALLKSE